MNYFPKKSSTNPLIPLFNPEKFIDVKDWDKVADLTREEEEQLKKITKRIEEKNNG